MASIIWQFFVAPLVGLALGGFPTSYIVSKSVAGIDPRKFASGSVSGRNTIRAAGLWPWGIVVGTTDILKSAIACAIVEYILFPAHPHLDYLVALTGVAAVAGHCWMPYLGFRGGKGLGTVTGTLLFLYWPFGLLILPIIIPLLSLLSGYSGVGSCWGVTFISPLFFMLDEIGPSTQVIQPFPHSYLTDGTGYGIPFTVVCSLGILLVIVLRYLTEFRKIRTGEAKVWKKLSSTDVMK